MRLFQQPARIFVFLAVFISLLTFQAGTILAVLGEDRQSVDTDQKVLSGEKESSVRKGYTIETLKGSMLIVQEYVDPKGMVFAVSWKGAGAPDLETLLGRYFQEFQAGLNERRKNVRIRRVPLYLKTDHLVVETGGKHRDLWGRAYLPSILPPEVTEKEIR